MNARVLAFTDRGYALAERIAEYLGGTAERCAEGGLHEWTEAAFREAEALIYVGAAGIAVRAIAPFIQHKAKDPAVLVVDETAKFVIPILSGHLGGANSLAEELASFLGAVPVITTATDRSGVFAVDVWAKGQGCVIPNPERIKSVSSKLLRGEQTWIFTEFPISGSMPDGVEPGDRDDCDFALTVHQMPADVLVCVPRIVTLGIGCRKGISAETIEERLRLFLETNRLLECAVRDVCTIDIKQDEPGLKDFCAAHGWELRTFSAEDLRRLHGSFSASAFVTETVGVDNVCERSAVLGSGGSLLIPKFAGEGVTLAAGIREFRADWGMR